MANFKNISGEHIRVIVDAGRSMRGDPYAQRRNMKPNAIKEFKGLAIQSARKDSRLQETAERIVAEPLPKKVEELKSKKTGDGNKV